MYIRWERWTEASSHVQAYGDVHDFDERNFGMNQQIQEWVDCKKVTTYPGHSGFRRGL